MDHLSEPELASVAALLSDERLGTFERFTGSRRSAIALHQAMLRLAASLVTVTAVVEIAWRNAVCAQLTDHFQTPDWLRMPPAPFQWDNELKAKILQADASARKTAYAKMNLDERQQLDRRAFCGGIAPHGLAYEHILRARQKVVSVSMGLSTDTGFNKPKPLSTSLHGVCGEVTSKVPPRWRSCFKQK